MFTVIYYYIDLQWNTLHTNKIVIKQKQKQNKHDVQTYSTDTFKSSLFQIRICASVNRDFLRIRYIHSWMYTCM